MSHTVGREPEVPGVERPGALEDEDWQSLLCFANSLHYVLVAPLVARLHRGERFSLGTLTSDFARDLLSSSKYGTKYGALRQKSARQSIETTRLVRRLVEQLHEGLRSTPRADAESLVERLLRAAGIGPGAARKGAKVAKQAPSHRYKISKEGCLAIVDAAMGGSARRRWETAQRLERLLVSIGSPTLKQRFVRLFLAHEAHRLRDAQVSGRHALAAKARKARLRHRQHMAERLRRGRTAYDCAMALALRKSAPALHS